MVIRFRSALPKCVLGLLLWWHCGYAADPRAPAIAVLYPDVGGAYRNVFASMIEGIDERIRAKSVAVPVSPGVNPAALQAELRRQDVKVVIALGRNGIQAGLAMDQDLKLVGGGVLNMPEADVRSLPVRTLAPDPALLLARLKTLQPRTRRVHVVYDPVQNGWLIRLAQRAAKAQGLELAAHEASDIKAAMQQYQAILAAMAPAADALWLPQDTVTVQDSVVLPLVLRSAWTANLTVFSSSAGHVRQGVLFALFPDNAAYGRQLGALAQAVLAGAHPEAGLAPLRELSSAINVSTLNHLQIKLGSKQLQDFDITFPE
jgi:putative ABC transport system substrate-binding protein